MPRLKRLPVLPLGDRLLVKPEEPAAETAGGIVLPGGFEQEHCLAIVVGVGEKVELDIHSGDRVVYSRHCGQRIEIDGVEHTIVHADDLWAKVN